MKGETPKEKSSLNNSASWLKIYRKFLEWEWYDDINTKVLFLHILLKANYRDKKWRGEIIPRGSFVTSIGILSKETHLSTMQTRTSLTKLKSTSEITSKSTSQFTLITVVKYDEYQGSKQECRNKITNGITNEQQTDNKPITTTIEVVEEVERKKENHSLKVLRSPEFWEELSLKFNTNRSYIEQECEKMEDWLKSKGKTQKDYKAFARNWIRRSTESQRKEYDLDRLKIDKGLQSTKELLNQYKK